MEYIEYAVSSFDMGLAMAFEGLMWVQAYII